MKNFLKPSLGKIFLLIVLMGGINLYIVSTSVILDAVGLFGIPLGFYPKGSTFLFNPEINIPQGYSYLYPTIIENLVIDLIFWYLISALIVWVYDYFKPKHTTQ